MSTSPRIALYMYIRRGLGAFDHANYTAEILSCASIRSISRFTYCRLDLLTDRSFDQLALALYVTCVRTPLAVKVMVVWLSVTLLLRPNFVVAR